MSTAAPALGRTGAGSEQALNLALRVIRLGPLLILIASGTDCWCLSFKRE